MLKRRILCRYILLNFSSDTKNRGKFIYNFIFFVTLCQENGFSNRKNNLMINYIYKTQCQTVKYINIDF